MNVIRATIFFLFLSFQTNQDINFCFLIHSNERKKKDSYESGQTTIHIEYRSETSAVLIIVFIFIIFALLYDRVMLPYVIIIPFSPHLVFQLICVNLYIQNKFL